MHIVFEGIDNSGKHTQAGECIEYLRKKGLKTHFYWYPDRNGPYYKIIGPFLKEEIDLSPTTQFLTFLSDFSKDQRAIFKEISDRKTVVMDRYVFSAIAYQDIAIERTMKVVKSLKFIRPDIIFYLDIPPEISFEREKRRKKESGRYEKKKERLLLARIKYKIMAENNFLGKWITVDGSKNIKDISKEVIKNLPL